VKSESTTDSKTKKVKLTYEIGHFQVNLCLFFKMNLHVKPICKESKIDLEENESVGRRHFYMTQTKKATWKWPIYISKTDTVK